MAAGNLKVQGMTGFGSAEKGGYRVEVRSLNHRYLDVSVKLPPPLSAHEPAIRAELKKRFERGKIDVYISTAGDDRTRLRLNRPLAGEIASALGELKKELSLAGEIEVRDFFPWKELLITEESAYEAGPLFEALAEALSGVEAMRLNEGEEVRAVVITGAGELGALIAEVESLMPPAAEAAKERFKERARSFLEGEADEGKLIQEAARAAEKVDIKEEVERLRGHIGYLRKLLSGGGKIGKTLDFILQELNRETNTIASKAEEQGIIRAAVSMKAAIEGIREQIQNVQ